MIDTAKLTPEELTRVAHEAIIREVGVSGFMRYCMANNLGSGDYTRDRHKWLPQHKTAEEFFAWVETSVAEARAKGEIP